MSFSNKQVEFGMQSRDPILQASSVWAARMMDWARTMPPRERGAALERAANRIRPGLGSQTRRLGAKLMRERRMMPDKALHRALQYAFSDAFAGAVLDLGKDAKQGRGLDRRNMLVPSGLAGLGTATSSSRTPEQITGDIVGGIVCSDGVTSLVGHAAGVNDTTKTAGDRQLIGGLTELGFIIARGAAGAAGHTCPPGTTPLPAPPPPPAAPATPPWLIPAAIGGSVLVGAAVLFIALR